MSERAAIAGRLGLVFIFNNGDNEYYIACNDVDTSDLVCFIENLEEWGID